MTEKLLRGPVPIPADEAGYLIATASRAPSVHNTQPWRFRIGQYSIELYSDPRRRLRVDRAGREMYISCGCALFGLRLAVRSLGYLPFVEMFPDPDRLRLLARVGMGATEPLSARERALLEAMPHRHTHRGAFAPGPLPPGLLAGLQHDSLTEGATLALVDPGLAYQRLADIITASERRLDLDPLVRAETRRWSRSADSSARDGVPAHAFAGSPDGQKGRLAQRDFDLGRGLGVLTADGPPASTAVLITPGDTRADWLRTGQALHRVLAHAASKWVFASMHTQPLEVSSIRALIRDRLGLPGYPQIVLQLGLARATRSTARRPPDELIDP